MEYNSKQEPISLPEYGRHIQHMVKYCLALEDRDERNRCARTIVQSMASLSPEKREATESDNVYWDHLALMSDFKLDVDFPEGVITKEKIEATIEVPNYTSHFIKYRYYGHILEGLVRHAVAMPQGKERALMEYLIALQMKRAYMTWNDEMVDDLKIFKDLYELSEGQIMLTPENCKLSINPNSIDKPGKKQKVGKKFKKK